MSIRSAVLALSFFAAGSGYALAADCADRDFRIALMHDLNEMPQAKNEGMSFLDLDEPETLSGPPNIQCRFHALGNDGSRAHITIDFKRNSVGQVIFEITNVDED